MGRPPRYDRDTLLDAAAALVAREGPRALTMAGVAREVGAPSGSLYHRFAGRAALSSALWLHCVDRFQTGLLAALERPDDPRAAVEDAAVHVLEWSRAHPVLARVLLYGTTAFDVEEWPPAAHDAVRERAGALDDGLVRLQERLGLVPGSTQAEVVVVAIVDIPYGLVRRLGPTTSRLAELDPTLVRRAARSLLAGSLEEPA